MVLCTGMQNNGQQLPAANSYEVVVAEVVLSIEKYCASLVLVWSLCWSLVGLCVEAREEALVAVDVALLELARIHPLVV